MSEDSYHIDCELSNSLISKLRNNFDVNSIKSGTNRTRDFDDKVPFLFAMMQVLKNIIPSSLTLLVEFGVIWSNIVFISMLNNATLISACGLGNTTIALVILSIDIGLCGGIDTLVSQAFGRKQYYLCGVYLNSTRIVICLLFIVQCVILLNCDFLFKLINQPPEIIELSQQYIFSVIPGVFLQMQYECLRRFLMSLGIFAPTLYIMTIVLIIHVAMLYLFLIVYELEILGVGIATSISGALCFCFLTLYVHLNKKLIPRESWNCFDKASIFKIVEFLKIGIPSCLMVLLDSWPYEVYTIYSGWLGVHQQACTVIIYNLWTILFLIPLGISYGSANLVGNNLGSGMPFKAKTYAHATLTVGILIITVIYILFVIFKDNLFSLYTDDEEILKHFDSAFIFIAFCTAADMIQVMTFGILRAIGYQNIVTICEFVAYWILMIPASYLFTFGFEFGYPGIWMGAPFGIFTLVVCYFYIVLTAPWQKLSDDLSLARNEFDQEKDE